GECTERDGTRDDDGLWHGRSGTTGDDHQSGDQCELSRRRSKLEAETDAASRAKTPEQHRPFVGPKTAVSSFQFLSRRDTIARRAGSNMERLFSKRTVLIALLALGWSDVVLAAQSKAQAPDPHALGMTEAVLDYCAKADPKGAAKVGARLKR